MGVAVKGFQRIEKDMTINNDLFAIRTDDIKMDRFKLEDIQIFNIHPCKHNPYYVNDDEEMAELVESIKANGILSPLIVRKLEADSYEIISGHRRYYAAKKLNMYVLPCFVGELTEDEADIIMVDSNLHRPTLKISEMAKAYKLKFEAMKRTAGRPKNNCTENQHNFENVENSTDKGKKSVEILAEELGLKRDKVQRLIKMADLTDFMLEQVDEKQMTMESGYNIAFLPRETQEHIQSLMIAEPHLIPKKFTSEMRDELLKLGETVTDVTSVRNMFIVFMDMNKKPKKAKQAGMNFKVAKDKLTPSAASQLSEYKKSELEALIIDLLNNHFGEDVK